MSFHHRHYKLRIGVKRIAATALLWNWKRRYRSNYAPRTRPARFSRDKITATHGNNKIKRTNIDNICELRFSLFGDGQTRR